MNPRTLLGSAPLAVALGLALLASTPAHSQVPPGGGGPGGAGGAGIPSKQEIEKRIKEELDKIPDTTVEWQKFKLTYKAIPTDPGEIIKNAGGLPPGMNPDQAAKQFGPMARPYIEKYLGEIGKLVADEEFKLKSTKLPAAEYTFGIVMEELTPIAIRLTGKTLKAPLTVPLKNQAAPSPHATLKVEIKESKKPEEFTIDVGFAKVQGAAGKFTLVKK